MLKMRVICISICALLLAGCSREASERYEETLESVLTEPYSIVESSDIDIHNEHAGPEQPVSLPTWQEAYEAQLQAYMKLSIVEDNDLMGGWYFVLHDIDRDGIPELSIFNKPHSGYVTFYATYTFRDGEVISLNMDGIFRSAVDGGFFTTKDNKPWIALIAPAGWGGWYIQIAIDGDQLIVINNGFSDMSEAGHERIREALEEGTDFDDWWSYEWHDLSLNGIPVTTEEFERVFGNWQTREWPELFEITEVNIQYQTLGMQKVIKTIDSSL